MVSNPALKAGNSALVTGGAAGIGLAVAQKLAGFGMNLVIVDNRGELLAQAAVALRDAGAAEVMTSQCDVADLEAMRALERDVRAAFGGVDVLVNNAGIQPGSAIPGSIDTWRRIIDVNLFGIIHGVHAFLPGMIERGRPGIIVNTGSKQGITTPPGDPAYNVAKSGVKTFTEALAHDLRNGPNPQLTAHLFIPGFVFTDLTRKDRTEKPDAAWTPEETAAFLFESLERGDFYILCPDNDVPRSLDEKRIAWAAGDIIENRPALSRWHPDFARAFADFVSEPAAGR